MGLNCPPKAEVARSTAAGCANPSPPPFSAAAGAARAARAAAAAVALLSLAESVRYGDTPRWRWRYLAMA